MVEESEESGSDGMSREIKFRAWEKLCSYMIPNAETGIYDEPDEMIDFGSVLSLDRFVVMQFTGLKDKKSIDIYEGDILKIIEVTNEKMEEYVTDVKWEDASFVLKSSDVDYYDTFLGAWSGDPNNTYPLFELEVIGNIYENPEILQKEDHQ